MKPLQLQGIAARMSERHKSPWYAFFWTCGELQVNNENNDMDTTTTTTTTTTSIIIIIIIMHLIYVLLYLFFHTFFR